MKSIRELEDLIIDVMYAGLLGGKMHHDEKILHIDWVSGRDVNPPSTNRSLISANKIRMIHRIARITKQLVMPRLLKLQRPIPRRTAGMNQDTQTLRRDMTDRV
jgi:hypothetical protein